MTEPNRIDPERLAALIDGKLGESEAAALRRELAFADEDTLAAFADAAAVTAELAAEAEAEARTAPAASARVLPMEQARRSRWRMPTTWAGIAAAAAIGIIIFRPSKPPYQPSFFVDAIPVGATAPEPAWSVTRGAGDGLSDRARAVRVGALLADVDLVVRDGKSPAAHARMLANVLEGALGAAGAATAWRGIASDTTARVSREQIAELGRSSIDAVDRDFAEAGAYLEAARIAGAAGDTSFFKRVSDGPLAAVENNPAVDATTQQQVKALRSRLRVQPLAPAGLGDDARDLLRMIAD